MYLALFKSTYFLFSSKLHVGDIHVVIYQDQHLESSETLEQICGFYGIGITRCDCSP